MVSSLKLLNQCQSCHNGQLKVYHPSYAKVVELVDTLVSEASARKGVGVQVPLLAPMSAPLHVMALFGVFF
jgi:hypothetical protein